MVKVWTKNVEVSIGSTWVKRPLTPKSWTSAGGAFTVPTSNVRHLYFRIVWYIIPKDALSDISVKQPLSQQSCPIAASRSTTFIFHNQTIHIGEQNIPCFTSTDTCTDRHALMGNSLAGLLTYLPLRCSLFNTEHAYDTRQLKEMLPGLLVTCYCFVVISDQFAR